MDSYLFGFLHKADSEFSQSKKTEGPAEVNPRNPNVKMLAGGGGGGGEGGGREGRGGGGGGEGEGTQGIYFEFCSPEQIFFVLEIFYNCLNSTEIHSKDDLKRRGVLLY